MECNGAIGSGLHITKYKREEVKWKQSADTGNSGQQSKEVWPFTELLDTQSLSARMRSVNIERFQSGCRKETQMKPCTAMRVQLKSETPKTTNVGLFCFCLTLLSEMENTADALYNAAMKTTCPDTWHTHNHTQPCPGCTPPCVQSLLGYSPGPRNPVHQISDMED